MCAFYVYRKISITLQIISLNTFYKHSMIILKIMRNFITPITHCDYGKFFILVHAWQKMRAREDIKMYAIFAISFFKRATEKKSII